jgi:hypothetical protein
MGQMVALAAEADYLLVWAVQALLVKVMQAALAPLQEPQRLEDLVLI